MCFMQGANGEKTLYLSIIWDRYAEYESTYSVTKVSEMCAECLDGLEFSLSQTDQHETSVTTA